MLFQLYDTDGSGNLEADEFLTAARENLVISSEVRTPGQLG